MSDRIIVDKNDDLYTLADIKDFFRMLYQLNDGMAARNRHKKYIEAVNNAMNRLMDADWIKVVRCGECRYWEPPTDIEADDGCTAWNCRNNYAPCQNQQTVMTWFCADGEREG